MVDCHPYEVHEYRLLICRSSSINIAINLPVSVQVEETGVELVPGHPDKP